MYNISISASVRRITGQGGIILIGHETISYLRWETYQSQTYKIINCHIDLDRLLLFWSITITNMFTDDFIENKNNKMQCSDKIVCIYHNSHRSCFVDPYLHFHFSISFVVHLLYYMPSERKYGCVSCISIEKYLLCSLLGCAYYILLTDHGLVTLAKSDILAKIGDWQVTFTPFLNSIFTRIFSRLVLDQYYSASESIIWIQHWQNTD
jgi:hypothetical protein